MKPNQLKKLKAEAGKHAELSHEQFAKLLLESPGKVPATEIDAGALAAAVTLAEFTALKADQRAYFTMLATAGRLPLTATAKAAITGLFAKDGETANNIQALLKRDSTLADELGLPGVTPSDVADALREEIP